MEYKDIFDISLSINENIILYPGDAEVSYHPICTIEKSGCNMTKITFGSHTGTHIDAPYHFLENGITIDQIPLNTFIGKCQVIFVEKDIISKEEIQKKINPGIKRIIFKTKNSTLWNIDNFSKKFTHLTLSGAEYLIENNIILVGIDYVSIEQFGTPDFAVHKKLFSKNIPILEGLNLTNIDPGEYYLIALPLKLENLDGSPVRAVLLK